jgi:aminopeptidase N
MSSSRWRARCQPGADAAAQRDQLLAAQLLDQAASRQAPRTTAAAVEARAGRRRSSHTRRAHLLRLVDQRHRSTTVVQVRQPAFAQSLEAAPAVVRAQRHGKDVAQFAVQVGQVALRMVDGAHGLLG